MGTEQYVPFPLGCLAGVAQFAEKDGVLVPEQANFRSEHPVGLLKLADPGVFGAVEILAERERQAARLVAAWIRDEELPDPFAGMAPVNVDPLVA